MQLGERDATSATVDWLGDLIYVGTRISQYLGWIESSAQAVQYLLYKVQ